MTNLKYHNKSLELIGSQPKFSGETYPNLPASVAEWYSLVNGVELLKEYSNTDFPLLPTEFKTYVYEGKEFIVFMYDNAGILWYSFENNGNEDPPIWANFDSPPDNWLRDSESFSTFIYTWLFDNLHYVKKDLIIRKKREPVQKGILETLFKEFVRQPVSHVGEGPTVYRFSSKDQRVSIFNYSTSSHWNFTADSQASLVEVYEKFEHLF